MKEYYNNIYITKYKDINGENISLHLKLYNDKIINDKSINLVNLENKTIKNALISLVSDIDFKKIKIKEI